ncbi:MAG TPA: hypothetical protein VHQ96_13125, partial [Gaiellaceae bacterium]|nr:hypothetical protein [Gaiellaceae bacterium]
MDQPTLSTLARELAESERLRAFVATPAAARVSEPLVPLFLAAVFLERGGPLVCVFPDDADARDAAEAAGWFLGEANVGLFASRGVRWGSGLEPPPHLVGERARALEILEAGGLVCASAIGAAEGIPPRDTRPGTIRLRQGDTPGSEELVERLVLAGYERVEQAQERGQFAVRGGIVDVYPSTGREPVRFELFGDEIESLRAYSAFTQRTLHPLEEGVIYPAVERRSDLVEPWVEDEPQPPPGDLVAPLRAPDLVWQADDARKAVEEELGADLGLGGAVELGQLPAGQTYAFEAQRPAVAARGLAEAERDLTAFVRGGNRVVVTFAHRGEALRTKGLLRRIEPVVLEPGDELPAGEGLFFAIAPARRGFVLRDLGLVLLPDTQIFRKRPPRADARIGRALQSFADLRTGDYVVHVDHGVGKLLGF